VRIITSRLRKGDKYFGLLSTNDIMAELAELRRIWESAGRPGAHKFRQAALRKGLKNLTAKEASDFVKAQSVGQIFAPPPKSDGKITSPEINARWQADIIDFKTKTPEKNKGYRLILICVDIFSRSMYVEPLESKEPTEVAAAFEKILHRARERKTVVKGKTGGRSSEVREITTDLGQEFKGLFADMLQRRGIAHTFKESINTLAIVDAAIRTLKDMIARAMTDEGSDSWLAVLPSVVEAYNSNSHSGIMNAAPNEVKSSPALQYELEKQSGYDTAHNVALSEARAEKLSAAGAFRTLEPRSTWNRAGQARYSEKVHIVAGVGSKNVISTEGVDVPIKNVKPVPSAAKGVKIPSELKPGRPIREAGSKEALRPFAIALTGILGNEALTIQRAGIMLRKIPGFAAAMTEARITGIGSFMRFLSLFGGEFVVEGVAPRQTVRKGP